MEAELFTSKARKRPLPLILALTRDSRLASLNESDLKAKLTRDGDLVVTAPKKGMEKKDEVRKISIAEEL